MGVLFLLIGLLSVAFIALGLLADVIDGRERAARRQPPPMARFGPGRRS